MVHQEEQHPEPTSSSNNDNTDKGLFMGLVLGMGAAALGFTTAAGVMVWKTRVENKLKADLESRQEKILENEMELTELKLKMEQIEYNYNALSDRLRSATEEKIRLEDQVRKKGLTLESWEARKDEALAAQLAHFESEQKNWGRRSEEYESMQRETLSEMEALRNQLEELRHNSGMLPHMDKQATSEEISRLEGELWSLHQELGRFAQAQPHMHQSIIRLDKELQVDMQDLSALQHSATEGAPQLNHDIQLMTDDLEQLREDMDGLLDATNSRRKEERHQHAAAIGNIHNLYEAKLKHQRQQHVQQMAKEVTSLQREHAGMIRDFRMVSAELAELYAKNTETEKQLRKLQQEKRPIEVKRHAASEPPQDSSEKTVAEDSPPSEAPRTIPKHTTEQKLGRGGGGKQWKPKGTRDPKSWMTRGEKSSTTEDSSAP